MLFNDTYLFWGKLFTCPYPLKVQSYPAQDQIPFLRSRVSGQEEEGWMGLFIIL